MRKHQTGVTLIELMIVVIIIAILAAVAYPAFTAQIRQGNRADMQGELQELALQLEQWRAQRFTYPNAADFAAQFRTAHDFYNLAYNPDADFQGWSITATPNGTTTQKNDGVLILNSEGQNCYVSGAAVCDPTDPTQSWSK